MATKTRTRKQSGTSTKKPKWTTVTYKQIEKKRESLGFSKSAMAQILGVTNSTYHNWRRGTTVPHPNQQEQIKSVLSTLTASSKPKKAAKRGAVSGKRRKAPGTQGRAPGNGGGRTNTMQDYTPSHPLFPATLDNVPGIATITGAWISSQKSGPSAGSVYKFVKGLRGALVE